MAANSKAIGLLFEVAGGGNINGETGKRINGQLRNLVGAINKSDTLKLKFTIDSNHFKKEIDLIKKQLQSINATSGNGVGGGASGGVSKHTEAWRNATAAMTEYYKLQTQVQQAMTRTNDIVANGDGTFSTHNQRWAELITQTNQAKAAFDTYNETSARVNMTLEERVNIDNRVNDAEARLAINMKTFEATGQQAWSNLTAKVHDYIGRVEESANRDEQAKQKLQELREMANGTDWRGYDALKDKLGEVQTYINQNSLATEAWYQKMLKTFGTRVRSLLAGLILAKVTTALRDIYNNVVEIDTAMTELKIVTQENDKALERYAKTAEKAAQRIGASVSDLIKSTTTYARLGFSLDEAGLLGELTTAYSKVGDVSVDEATKNITGIVKAYKVNAEDLEFVIDKLIYVGRKFAISSGEIGEGMNNAASSLAANGNTLNQAMGILTAANTTVQDISRASTATRTIAARLSASKQELEELGETVEADTVIKLKDAFKAYGIEITDGNDKLKSTYDILGSIAEKWDELNEEERSAITTLAAGTRQQDIFYSIIANWNDAQRVVAEADGATGELADATAQRLDSIQGKLDQLKAKFETLSAGLLESDLVKFIADILNLIVGGINTVVQAIQYLGGLKTVLLALVTVLAIAKGGLILYNLELAKTAALTGILAFFQKLKTGIMLVVNAIPNAIVAWKAYAAGTVSASTAMQASIPVIGLVLAALTALVGGLSLVGNANQENIEKIREASDTATELSGDIYDLTQQYIALSKAVKTDDSVKQKLIETQEELIKKLGLEKYEVDELVKKYGSYTEAIKQASIAKLQEEERDIRGGLSVASDNLVDAAKEHTFKNSFMVISRSKANGFFSTSDETRKEQISAYYALKALEDQGFISNGSYSTYTDKNGQKYSQGFAMYQRYKYDMDTPAGIMAAYEDLGKMLDIVGDTSGQNNFVYKALYDEYSGMTDVVKKYKEEVGDLNTNLAQQYTVAGLVGKELPKTQDEFNKYRNSVIQAAVSSGEFVGTQQDIEYAIDSILRYQSEFSTFYNKQENTIKGVSVSLKSLMTILDEVQGGFDGISKALESLSEDGYLTADSLASLAKLESDGALGGLKLKDVLIQDANGFKIAEDALQKYVDALIAQYTITEAFATLQDKENAIANLENLRRVFYTLSKTQATSTDATKAQKKALEDQRDALKDQLDAYKKLIDLRKELLQQYENELTYKKELAEKERRVSRLQTQLAVSQLDTSAAGRAKSRQLSKDLKEAQEELDDFTLEHAIDVVTNELDRQYAEYENYANGQIDDIEDKIDDLGSSTSSSISGAANSVATAAASAADKITEAISAIELAPIINVTAGGGGTSGGGSGYFEQAKAYIASHGLMQGDKGRWGQDPAFRKILNQLTPEEFAALKGYTQGKAVYGANGRLIRYEKVPPTYHSGGIVGDMTRLKSTELFAKLLKGEFVATPQMMNRFMTSTLPTIASNGGNTEINAPLISIQCDNVTQESLPRLEEIVNEAVKTIKKQLDSGMSRTGYKRQATKLLT